MFGRKWSFLVGILFLAISLDGIVPANGFGVSFLACTLNVVCGTAQNAIIGNLTVQKVFWPVTWTLTYMGGDPLDSTLYMTIDQSTGVISRNTAYPGIFTQQVWEIDGVDSSLSQNMVSAYMIVKWPQCGLG